MTKEKDVKNFGINKSDKQLCFANEAEKQRINNNA
jgi:hypothetical protein